MSALISPDPISPAAPETNADANADVDVEQQAGYRIDASDPTAVTGTSRLSELTQLEAILDWPGLYLLSTTCEELIAGNRKKPGRGRGRRRQMPPALLLAMVIAARVTTSLASALATVRDQGIWHGRLRQVWEAREETENHQFPLTAPNRDQVRHFVDTLLNVPGWEQALQQRFQQIALAQAIQLGNLDPDARIDWTQPSLSNTVIGDGTVIRPLTDVSSYLDRATGEVKFSGSRAIVKPRMAAALTDLVEDGKGNLRGLNMVSLLTPTAYGPVILGTGTARGAEQWAAADLFESVASKANGGVHNLLWDRVYNGWLVDWVMAQHRTRVFNKSVADGRKSAGSPDDMEAWALQRTAADREMQRLATDARSEMLLAECDQLDGDNAPKQTNQQRAAMFQAWRMQDLYEIFYSRAPQPLGISLYRSTSASTVTGARNQKHRKNMEIVRSMFRPLGAHTHDGSAGSCTHQLYVDDGALHTVAADPDLGCLVKVATATCVSSTPRRRSDGTWGSTDVWSMPCPHGDFEITTNWDPHKSRYTPDTPAEDRKPPANMALNDLRPISRAQAQEFADIANHRNQAESFNQWYERSLPHHGRAASLSADAQALDFLAAACLRNAITWARWQHADD